MANSELNFETDEIQWFLIIIVLYCLWHGMIEGALGQGMNKTATTTFSFPKI
jgi:hypothetical protein